MRQMGFSEHSLAEREFASSVEPFGPRYWVRRSALTGFKFLEGIGPHPTRRTLGDETPSPRQLRAHGHCPVYSPDARVRHRIEAERTTRGATHRTLLTRKSPFALLLAFPLLGAACLFESDGDDDDPDVCQTECEEAR